MTDRNDSVNAAHFNVVGLGEVLLRLSAVNGGSLGNSPSLTVHSGGAEANVLAAMSAQGHASRLITRLAQDPLAARIECEVTASGVQIEAESDPLARTPLYFVEHGLAPRPTQVSYDRRSSAMASLSESSVDWASATRGTQIAIASGITSALSPGACAANAAFLTAAHKNGVTTAFDINHREKLWTWPQCRAETLRLLPSIDILFASSRDVSGLLGAQAAASTDSASMAQDLLERHGLVAIVVRESQYGPGQSVDVRATVVTDHGAVTSEAINAAAFDPFGAGDAAAGIYLDSFVRGLTPTVAAHRTAMAAALQHTLAGDRWTQGRLSDALEKRRIVR